MNFLGYPVSEWAAGCAVALILPVYALGLYGVAGLMWLVRKIVGRVANHLPSGPPKNPA